MNFKKFIAGSAACAMGILSLATVAFADADNTTVADNTAATQDGTGAETTEPIELKAENFESTYKFTVNAYDYDKLTSDTFYAQIQMGHINTIEKLTVSATNGTDTVYLNISTNWDADAPVEAKDFEWKVEGINPWTGAGLTFPEGVVCESGDESWTITIEAEIDVQRCLDYWVTPEPDGVGYGAEGIHDLTIFCVDTLEEGRTSMTLADKGSGKNEVVIPHAGEEPGNNTQGGDQTSAPAENTAASSTNAASTSSPATTTTANSSSSSSSDSGWIIWLIVGVAAAAVIVVVIVIVAKKKK